MQAWSCRSGSLFIMVVIEVGLEYSGGVSLLSPDHMLTIGAGGHGGSFIAATR